MTVYDGDVPSMADEDQVQRLPIERTARQGITTVLMAVFDPQLRTARLAHALGRLWVGDSDVAVAIGTAVKNADADPRTPTAAIVISDGLQNEPGLRFFNPNAPGLVRRAAAEAKVAAQGSSVDLLGVLGVGQVPNRETPKSSSLAGALVSDWTRICQATRAAPKCQISPEL